MERHEPAWINRELGIMGPGGASRARMEHRELSWILDRVLAEITNLRAYVTLALSLATITADNCPSTTPEMKKIIHDKASNLWYFLVVEYTHKHDITSHDPHQPDKPLLVGPHGRSVWHRIQASCCETRLSTSQSNGTSAPNGDVDAVQQPLAMDARSFRTRDLVLRRINDLQEKVQRP